MDNSTKPYAVKSSRWVDNEHLQLFKDLAVIFGGHYEPPIIEGDKRTYMSASFKFVDQFNAFDEEFERQIKPPPKEPTWLQRILKIFSFRRT